MLFMTASLYISNATTLLARPQRARAYDDSQSSAQRIYQAHPNELGGLRNAPCHIVQRYKALRQIALELGHLDIRS
jgi:hypothetical protein